MSSQNSLLLLSVMLTLATGLGLWLESRLPSTLLRAGTVIMGLLASGVVAYAFWKRQASESTRLSAGSIWKLALFGGVMLLLTSGGVGTRLAYQRAYDIVHPARNIATRMPESVGITNYRTVSFVAPDGVRLRGWYAPPGNGAVIILVHGLGANRAQLLDDAGILYAHGYGVLLYDSRNCGESEGTLTTLGLQEVNDVEGAVAFILAESEEEKPRIGLLGHSMGGATVLMAGARNERVRAVIAQSTYTSLEENIGSSLQQLTGLPPFPFAPLVVYFGEQQSGMEIGQVKPIEVIGELSPRAVLLVHGALDELVAVSNVHALYAAAGEPRELYVIANAGHGGLPQAGAEEYERRVVGFLEQNLLGP